MNYLRKALVKAETDLRYVLKSLSIVIQSTTRALWDAEELHYSATTACKTVSSEQC